MKLFAKLPAVVDEILKWEKAERYRREDRGIVSNFFNGAPPLTDQEAEDLGFTINVNHLFGYKELDDAADQIFGLYTKPATMIEVTLDAAWPGKGTLWGMEASLEASRVFKKVSGFKSAYQGVSGDGSMHGEALFFYPNSTFPLPRQCPLSKMLIPDDATTDPSELVAFGIETELKLKDLHQVAKRSPKNWKMDSVRKVLRKIYDGCFIGEFDTTNLEEVEYRRQENSSTNNRRRIGVDVTYFYSQRCDKFGNPYDLKIVMKGDVLDERKEEGILLYDGECIVPSITQCLHPFFMDCIIGGAPKWHRVLGLGPLNYQTNHAIELLINRAQQATMEGSMNLWQARDTTTRDVAEKILLKHNGVLPEGLNLVPNRFAPNFGGILEMIQFFRQAASKNARGVTPNNGDQNDQLEVQAMAELNAGASQTNNRTSNWYDYLDRMWTESFRRLTNPYIEPHEPGYSEIMDFQTAMERRGIPLYYLQPANVQVRAVRLVGDGLRQKELSAAQYLTANRSQFAPEVQPKITRICTGLVLDNYKLAEELTPIQEEPDAPQEMRAESENSIMMTTRRPQMPKVDDIDEIHVMAHFPALEVMISDGLQFQKAAFTPQQAQAFQIVGAHIMMHIHRIEGKAVNQRNDPEREKSRAFMEQLNEMAQMGQKLVNNMEQQQEGQQQEMDPVEMAKLQIALDTLKLQRDKLGHAIEKFNRTQSTREQNTAFDQVMKMGADRREELKLQREGAQKDAELALKISGTGKKSE